MKPYVANLVASAVKNPFFRRVLHTGARSQLVLMSIPPGDDVGEELHEHVEQTLFVVKGTGVAHLAGQQHEVGPGSVVLVPPGIRHNLVNVGSEPLQLYTVYAPANHLDGRIHRTHADADADRADEAFGHSAATTH